MRAQQCQQQPGLMLRASSGASASKSLHCSGRTDSTSRRSRTGLLQQPRSSPAARSLAGNLKGSPVRLGELDLCCCSADPGYTGRSTRLFLPCCLSHTQTHMRHCRHKSQPSTRWPLASCRTHAHSAAPRSSTWRPPFHTSAAAGRVEDDGLTWSDTADDVHSHVPLAPTFVSVLFAEAIGDTRPLLDERQLLHGGGGGGLLVRDITGRRSRC